jgi:hypothetical protein
MLYLSTTKHALISTPAISTPFLTASLAFSTSHQFLSQLISMLAYTTAELQLFHNNTAHPDTTQTIPPSDRHLKEDVPYCYGIPSENQPAQLSQTQPYPAVSSL